MTRLITLIIAVILATDIVESQLRVEDIKNDSRNYYFAEGEGENEKSAFNDAVARIMTSISSSIRTKTEVDYSSSTSVNGSSKNARTDADHNVDITTTVTSSGILRGVQTIVLNKEPNKVKVFCYVEKRLVEKIYDDIAETVRSFVEIGKGAERHLQIDDALRNYSWALTLASYMSKLKTVIVDFDGYSGDATVMLQQKIRSVLANIAVYNENPQKDKNTILVPLRFEYAGKEVSSITFNYLFNGSYVGPKVTKNGSFLLELPKSQKDLKIQIETLFKNEAEHNSNPYLATAFSDNDMLFRPNNGTFSIKIGSNDGSSRDSYKMDGHDSVLSDMSQNNMLRPEPAKEYNQVEKPCVTDYSIYMPILAQVEKAIQKSEPFTVKEYFTEDGYEMFNTLLTKTGVVTLAQNKTKYDFIEGNNGQILARFCRVRIKFKQKRDEYMENIVFRINPGTRKIESLAFALTNKAEEDIFRQASNWTNVSRFAILNFLEDYQTAYALKRLDFIEKTFSDDAIIITGSVLKRKPTKYYNEGATVRFKGANVNVTYHNLTKEAYLKRLKEQFDQREYIHLTFEDNYVDRINTNGRFPDGTAMAIQVRQRYASPVYSDVGILSLMIDTRGDLPIIHIRFWQPLDEKIVPMETVFSKENISWN